MLNQFIQIIHIVARYVVIVTRKDRLKTHYAKCKQQDEPAQTQNSQNLLEMTEFFNDKPSIV